MLVLLAEKDDVVNTADLGKRMLVSPKYLRKLAGPLEKHELIRSIQGIYGGYQLNKKAGEIKLSDVFDAFGESVDISGCTGGKDCPLQEDCLTRPLWEHLKEVLENELHRVTVKNLLDQEFI